MEELHEPRFTHSTQAQHERLVQSARQKRQELAGLASRLTMICTSCTDLRRDITQLRSDIRTQLTTEKTQQGGARRRPRRRESLAADGSAGMLHSISPPQHLSTVGTQTFTETSTERPPPASGPREVSRRERPRDSAVRSPRDLSHYRSLRDDIQRQLRETTKSLRDQRFPPLSNGSSDAAEVSPPSAEVNDSQEVRRVLEAATGLNNSNSVWGANTSSAQLGGTATTATATSSSPGAPTSIASSRSLLNQALNRAHQSDPRIGALVGQLLSRGIQQLSHPAQPQRQQPRRHSEERRAASQGPRRPRAEVLAEICQQVGRALANQSEACDFSASPGLKCEYYCSVTNADDGGPEFPGDGRISWWQGWLRFSDDQFFFEISPLLRRDADEGSSVPHALRTCVAFWRGEVVQEGDAVASFHRRFCATLRIARPEASDLALPETNCSFLLFSFESFDALATFVTTVRDAQRQMVDAWEQRST